MRKTSAKNYNQFSQTNQANCVAVIIRRRFHLQRKTTEFNQELAVINSLARHISRCTAERTSSGKETRARTIYFVRTMRYSLHAPSTLRVLLSHMVIQDVCVCVTADFIIR